MESDSRFGVFVDDLVREGLSSPTDWGTLLTGLPGVYPATVHETVVRLGLTGMVLPFGGGQVRKAVTATGAWERGLLATPHILDGTWWFSDAAIKTLVGQIASHTESGDSVLLLGTPTLFFAGSNQLSDRDFTLVENDISVPDDLARRCRITNANIMSEDLLLPIEPSVIVADPPWYVPETLSFMWWARRHARRGTVIFLSTPPVGTRPGVGNEWASLLLWCKNIGLELKEYRRAALAYITPPFEQNALRAAGVHGCPMDWRRGDLAVFVCTQDHICARPEFDRNPHSTRWTDISIGRVRIRVGADVPCDMSAPILEPLFPDGVLPTVSRRDTRLHKVRLWTSGNRVFGCRGEMAIRSIARALAVGADPLGAVRNDVGSGLDKAYAASVDVAAVKLDQIVRSEERELSDWNRCLNHDVVELAS